MKKILLAIDPLNIDTVSVDFACYMATLSKSKLIGVFLENLLTEEVSEPTASVHAGNGRLTRYEREQVISENVQFFRKACEKREVYAFIHRDRGMPGDELIEESRFADLIIVDAALSFSRKFEGIPSGFVKDILEQAECPVLVAPMRLDDIKDIVFAYDGSKSAAFAMRQFSYIFPEFKNTKVTLLEINKSDDFSVRSNSKITEWLKANYQDARIEVLQGNTREELFKYLFRKTNLLLVMGAYGRSMLSQFFKESRAALIVRTTNFPVFISHH